MNGTHAELELLEQYWCGELDAAAVEALEDHVFECAACTAASGKVSDLVSALGDWLPPFLTDGAIVRLERRGMRLLKTEITPGERVTVPFGPEVDLLVHRLKLDLSGIDRLDCEVEAADGTPIIAFENPYFDPTVGEVNLVCQRHYAEQFPPDAVLRLVAVTPAGRRQVAQYGVMHVVTKATPSS
jgi:hypothetical protein